MPFLNHFKQIQKGDVLGLTKKKLLFIFFYLKIHMYVDFIHIYIFFLSYFKIYIYIYIYIYIEIALKILCILSSKKETLLFSYVSSMKHCDSISLFKAILKFCLYQRIFIYIYIYEDKVGKHSREQSEGSLYNSYYTKM